MIGSPFNDYEINARGGADVVHAKAGYDRVYGGAGRDTLNGEGDTDELFGGTGADTLNEGTTSTHPRGSGLCGGRGDDTLNGGPGPDRYQFGYLWGKDTVVGEVDDAPGDIIDFNMYGGQMLCGELGGTVGSSLTIDMPAGQVYETSEGPSGANTVSFVGSHIEIVQGGSRDDTIIGDSLPNELSGMQGNDTINAGRGNDRVVEDDLYFDLGDDIINAGRGNDTVYVNHVARGAPELNRDSDTVDCGPGRDKAVVDDNDTTKHCESVTDPDPGIP